MGKSFLVKDYMNYAPVTVSPDCSVIKAAQIILKNKISGVVVIDRAKKVLGMLSELDCLRAMSDAIYNEGRNTPSLRVDEIMSKDIKSSSPNDGLLDTVTIMLKLGQRRRPVIENDRLVGQVTCRQLLKAIDSFA